MSDNTGGRGEPSSKTLPSVWGYTLGKCVCVCVLQMSVCERVGVWVSVRGRNRTEKVIMCCYGCVAVKSWHAFLVDWPSMIQQLRFQATGTTEQFYHVCAQACHFCQLQKAITDMYRAYNNLHDILQFHTVKARSHEKVARWSSVVLAVNYWSWWPNCWHTNQSGTRRWHQWVQSNWNRMRNRTDLLSLLIKCHLSRG